MRELSTTGGSDWPIEHSIRLLITHTAFAVGVWAIELASHRPLGWEQDEPPACRKLIAGIIEL